MLKNCPFCIDLSRRLSIAILISFSILLVSCNSDDGNDSPLTGIAGEWILVEMLADPGDGSGVFMPVDSSRTISFVEDGTYSSNSDVCSFSTEDGNSTSGTYMEVEDGYTIDCGTPFPTPLFISLDEGDLIIAFSCFEPCLQKFRRVD